MNVIAQSLVRIQPSFHGFRTQLRTGLAAATAGVKAKVEVAVDDKSMARVSRTLQRQMPKLVDFGAPGIRPTHALIAAATALSPALLAVGSSAAQAGTSIVALGSAAYGGSLAVVGLTQAFAGVLGALKLHTAEQKGLAGQTAKSAKSVVDNTDAIAAAKERLRKANRDEKDAVREVSAAYAEARQKARDLREELSDLYLKLSGQELDVEEAKRKLQEVNNNFFATSYDRRRAVQELKERQEEVSDTRREITETKADLAKRKKTGAGGTPEVIKAQRQLRDAIEARRAAERELARAAKGTTAATAGTVAATGQLNAALDKLSPAGRAMYHWLVDNTEMFLRLRRRMEQAILPGFLTFLKQVSSRRRGESTLDVLADGTVAIGKAMSRTTANVGRFMATGWFKGQLKKLNRDNAASFDLVGQAALKILRPITRLVVAASPLIRRLSKYLLSVATAFSDWMGTVSDADLGKWFRDAGDALSDWWDIAVNLGRIVLAVFKASLPSGDNLVSRLKTFTGYLADLAESDEGRQRLTEFFTFFRELDYGKLARIAGSIVAITGAVKAGKLAASSPFYLLIGLLMKEFPEQTSAALQGIASGMLTLLSWVDSHPKAAASILAILSAYKFFVGFKGLAGKLKLPGINTATTTMTVRAGVVNVYGPSGQPTLPDQTPGQTPTVIAPTAPKAGGLKGWLTKFGGGLLRVAGGLAVVDIVFQVLGSSLTDEVKGLFDNAPWVKGSGPNRDWHKFTNWFVDTFPQSSFARWLAGKDKPQPPKPDDRRGYTPLSLKNWNGPGLPAWAKSMRAEKWALGDDSSGLLNWIDTPGPARTRAFEAYIRARRNSVADYVAYVNSTQGPIAAQAALNEQNAASDRTLQDLAKRMGLTKGEVNKYSKEIKDVPPVSETRVTTPGLPGAKQDFITLKTKIDPVTGKKVIEVAMGGGTPAVFNTLRDAAIYQLSLQTGLDLYHAGQALKRDEERNKMYGLPNNTPGSATGGPVRGFSPHPKADNLPYMLTANEFVQPVDAVKHYGVGFMEAIRTKQFPKMATGGLAGNTGKWPFKIDISKTVIPQPQGGGVVTGDMDVARVAESTARALGATTKQLIALFETGLVESGMRNINYGTYDSIGFLQQRPSQGWGTRQQIMDPAYATRKFIQAAKRKDKKNQTAGQLAQAVQVSAYPDRYDKRYADAVALLNAEPPYVLGGGAIGPVATPGRYRGTKAGLIAFGHYLQRLGYDVSEHPAFGGVHPVHADGSAHYRGSAIDVNHGAGTSAREQAYLRRIIPEATRRGFHTLFMVPGHYNHAHFDLGPGRALGGLAGFEGKLPGWRTAPPAPVAQPWLADPSTWQSLQQRKWNWEDYQSLLRIHQGDVRRRKAHEAHEAHLKHLAYLHDLHVKHVAHMRHKYPGYEGDAGRIRKGHKPKAVHAYDSGGVLKPGVTVAVNNTGKPETVRTYEQEQALHSRYQRIDRRDLALLAAYIANAIAGQHIRMDGRKVAETVRGYDYLPRGV